MHKLTTLFNAFRDCLPETYHDDDRIYLILWKCDAQCFVQTGTPMFPGIVWVKTATSVRPRASEAGDA